MSGKCHYNISAISFQSVPMSLVAIFSGTQMLMTEARGATLRIPPSAGNTVKSPNATVVILKYH